MWGGGGIEFEFCVYGPTDVDLVFRVLSRLGKVMMMMTMISG